MTLESGAAATAPDWRSPTPLDLDPILEAALTAFHEVGFHGSSVRDLAKRTGVTVPALYYHYENKEGILYALIQRSMGTLLTLTRAAYDEPPAHPGQRFLNVVECVSRFMANSGQVSFLDAEMRALTDPHREAYIEQRDEIERMLLASMKEGMDAGVFSVKYPRDTTRALLGMIQTIVNWYRPDGLLSVDELAVRYVDIAARTVGATLPIQPS
jgi:AcrR family transcriptional regulator